MEAQTTASHDGDRGQGNTGQHRTKITKSVVANATPREREFTLWDSRLPGFGLRVRPSGAKSFIFSYRTAGGRKGIPRRVTIKASTPENALIEAKKLAAKVHGGLDPAKARAEERNARTVGEVLDNFIRDHVKANLKEKTAADYERIVGKILKPKRGIIS